MTPRLLLIKLGVSRGLAVSAIRRHQVPLVDDDDDGASAFVSIACDGSVAGGHTFDGIDDDERNISSFEVLARHDDGQFFGHQFGLALAANSSGIDEAVSLAAVLDKFIDRVARCSGNWRDDGAASPGKRVQQRGLADVGAADDGDLGKLRSFFFLFFRGRFGGHAVFGLG